jgi:hypothetical protein
MRTQRLALAVLAVLLVAAVLPGAAMSSGTNATKVQCLSGDGGTCSITSDGVVTLDTTGVTPGTEMYVHALLQNVSLRGKLLSDVGQLAFHTDTVDQNATGLILIPLQGAGGSTLGDMIIYPSLCNDGSGNLDVIHDSSCSIAFLGETFANWPSLLAAHSDWRLSTETYPRVAIFNKSLVWSFGPVFYGKGH